MPSYETTPDINNLQSQIAQHFYSYSKDISTFDILGDKIKQETFGTKHFIDTLPDEIKRDILNQENLGEYDQYGILKFTISREPSNLEFQLKTPIAYGGPKTEDYLERLDAKTAAAKAWVAQQDYGANKTQLLNQEIDILLAASKKRVKKTCAIDHTIMGNLEKGNKDTSEHFTQKHQNAIAELASFMQLLTENIKVQDPEIPDKKIKKAITAMENDMMSQKRPELITVRHLEEGYFEMNQSIPVDKERTVSSAKKDEIGVANWLKTENTIYKAEENNKGYDFVQKSHTASFRSASIVPNDLLTQNSTLAEQLAYETSRHNIIDHILPALLKEKDTEKSPIEINLDMLTLISPVHKIVDKFSTANPDAGQFKAIREAMNYYNGRTIPVEHNGQKIDVKFNANYHNYGVNTLRGFPMERNVNLMAFNKLLDRSQSQILAQTKSEILSDLPAYTSQENKKLNNILKSLKEKYKALDLKQFNKTDFNTLMQLHIKKNRNEEEEKEYKSLSKTFLDIQNDNQKIKSEIETLETEKSKLYAQVAKRRIEYLSNPKQQGTFDTAIDNLRKEDPKTADHIRTLIECAKLQKKGYDPLISRLLKKEDRNDLNYQITSYIEHLNKFHENCSFHKTCKSGKDRTNSAEESAKALNFISLLLEKVPKYEDKQEHRRNLFEKGFLQGAGNAICGFNKKPSAQQVSGNDIKTEKLNIQIVKITSSLQKGIDKLKITKKNRPTLEALKEEVKSLKENEKVKNENIANSIEKNTNNCMLTNYNSKIGNTQVAEVENISIETVHKNAKLNTSFVANSNLNKNQLELSFKDKENAPYIKGEVKQSQENKLIYSVEKVKGLYRNDEFIRNLVKFALHSSKKETVFNIENTKSPLKEKVEKIFLEEINKLPEEKRPQLHTGAESKATLSKLLK